LLQLGLVLSARQLGNAGKRLLPLTLFLLSLLIGLA
jgi:hypothetical protein